MFVIEERVYIGIRYTVCLLLGNSYVVSVGFEQ